MSVVSLPARPLPVRWALAALLAASLLYLVGSVVTVLAAASGRVGGDPSIVASLVAISLLVQLGLIAAIARGWRVSLVAYAVLLGIGLINTVISIHRGGQRRRRADVGALAGGAIGARRRRPRTAAHPRRTGLVRDLPDGATRRRDRRVISQRRRHGAGLPNKRVNLMRPSPG